MLGHSSSSVHKIDNKSIAVKLSLTQPDIDQVVLLTLPSHACQELLFSSCQVVITKASHWAACKQKTVEDVMRMQQLLFIFRKVFWKDY